MMIYSFSGFAAQFRKHLTQRTPVLYRHLLISLPCFIIVLIQPGLIHAQKVREPKAGGPEWEQPYAPFRMAGNLYYVGTYDLASFLITTSAGHILINTGLASSGEQIKKNIEALGFRVSAIKILLTNQAHFDHLGAMASLKRQTHALFMAYAAEQDVLKSGGDTDYEMGGQGSTFEPLETDKLLYNGDTIKLGNTQLLVLHHPGHTKGSCSYLLTVQDSLRRYRVLIANLPTIITERKFKDIRNYPSIARDYANTFENMKGLQFDLWVASHASQFNLHTKQKPGDPYNPMAFADRAGYDAALDALQKAYEEKLKKDE